MGSEIKTQILIKGKDEAKTHGIYNEIDRAFYVRDVVMTSEIDVKFYDERWYTEHGVKDGVPTIVFGPFNNRRMRFEHVIERVLGKDYHGLAAEYECDIEVWSLVDFTSMSHCVFKSDGTCVTETVDDKNLWWKCNI